MKRLPSSQSTRLLPVHGWIELLLLINPCIRVLGQPQ
jgi:hypothetical protein